MFSSTMFQFRQGSIALVGVSCSAKMRLLLEFIKNTMFEKKVETCLLCYMVHQPIYEMAKCESNFVLHKVLPSKEYVDEFLAKHRGHTLLVLDDLGVCLASNPFSYRNWL